jgi:hypothetical protein
MSLSFIVNGSRQATLGALEVEIDKAGKPVAAGFMSDTLVKSCT